MKKGLIGKKIGMTQVFDAQGHAIPVTVVEAGPCTITQKNTMENDGHSGGLWRCEDHTRQQTDERSF